MTAIVPFNATALPAISTPLPVQGVGQASINFNQSAAQRDPDLEGFVDDFQRGVDEIDKRLSQKSESRNPDDFDDFVKKLSNSETYNEEQQQFHVAVQRRLENLYEAAMAGKPGQIESNGNRITSGGDAGDTRAYETLSYPGDGVIARMAYTPVVVPEGVRGFVPGPGHSVIYEQLDQIALSRTDEGQRSQVQNRQSNRGKYVELNLRKMRDEFVLRLIADPAVKKETAQRWGYPDVPKQRTPYTAPPRVAPRVSSSFTGSTVPPHRGAGAKHHHHHRNENDGERVQNDDHHRHHRNHGHNFHDHRQYVHRNSASIPAEQPSGPASKSDPKGTRREIKEPPYA